MANVLVEESSLSAIADSIRAKNGTATTYKPAEMPGAIDALPTGGADLEAKTVSYTPTESVQTDQLTPSTGYDGFSSVNVTVDAIDDEYVGSAVQRKSSSDLTASGATVTAPAGYYENAASKSVASGTEGTPTATKGAVSNHAVSVTPSVTNAAGYISGGTKTGTAVSVSASELVSGNKAITANGTGIDVANYSTVSVAVPSDAQPTQTKSATPTESAQTITPDTGYLLSSVSVGAIASDYVGSQVARRSSSDLTASGAMVTAPAGYYASAASKSVASGTAGTPTATKGSVSNHQVSVTPSVTNTTGYITGSTKTGTAVTVSASELVSGSETKTANGTYDVTNLASLVVNVSGSGVQHATGTYKPTQTYNTTGNREICTLSDIGFTPTKFMFRVKTRADVSGIQYAVLYAEYESTWPLRITVRYSNSSNTSAASVAQSDWTTQSNYYLYYNNNTIYFRTTSQFILVANLEYIWEAFA